MGPEGSSPIRLLVVDDHEMVVRGVRDMLSFVPDIEVCGVASSAPAAVEQVEALAPDVVLLDLRLGVEGSGTDVARILRLAAPRTRVLMFTALVRDADVVAALMAGASGFIQKGVDVEQLADAVRAVAAGGTAFDEAITAHVMLRLHDEDADPRLATLSERERDILVLMAEGRSNREIATHLHLSEKTVKNHITHLLAKLGVQRRTEAVRFVARP